MAVLHLVCIDDARKLWHTIRRNDTNGTWFPFGPVRDVVRALNPNSLTPGQFEDVACAGVVNDLHVCLLTASNEIIHTVRWVDGSWSPFGDAAGQAQAPSGGVFSIAATQLDGQLQMGVAKQPQQGPYSRGSLFHTIRNAAGAWRPFQNFGGSFDDIAFAEAGGDLHFCGIRFDGLGNGHHILQHALRPPGGSFTQFWNVRDTVLALNQGLGQMTNLDPGSRFLNVGCTGLAGQLHVFVISDEIPNGRLFHTVRRTDGTWSPFTNVVNDVVTQNSGSFSPTGLGSISCATVNGEIHIVCVDIAGRPWHTIRRANGTYRQGFGPVVDVVAAQNPGSPVPGPIRFIAIADAF